MRKTVTTSIMLALMFATFGGAQESKPALRTFIPPVPPTGYAVSAVLVRDPPCAKDYLKGVALEGVAQGKAFEELVKFGCAEILHGVYHVTSREPVTVAGGDKPTWFWHSLLVKDTYLSRELLGGERPAQESHEGWIAESSIVKIDEYLLGGSIYASKNSEGFLDSMSESQRIERLWKRVAEARELLKLLK